MDWIRSLAIGTRVKADRAASRRCAVDCGVGYHVACAGTAVAFEGVCETHPLAMLAGTLSEERKAYVSYFVGHCLAEVVVRGCSAWYGIVSVCGTRELLLLAGTLPQSTFAYDEFLGSNRGDGWVVGVLE